MSEAPSTAVEGIDADGVTGWFAEHVPAAEAPLSFDRITGGRSNLTFRVTDAAASTWALRRPPLHGGLGSAHDMGREHGVMSALTPTDVPVPTAIGLCEDEDVIGAPFFVMDFVEGPVLRTEREATDALDEDGRRRVGLNTVDALVELHAVDPDAVGLGELGRKEAYVERQLKRWHGQWEKSKTRELAEVDDIHRHLGERVPEQQGAAIVHGDYRLDNLILSSEGEVAAIVDWELCTLGDPLADLGLLQVYWARPGDDVIPLDAAPTVASGFPERGEVAERYAERSGRDISELPFYVALGYWKLAIILEGVYARYAAGAYGDTDDSFESFPQTVEALASAASDALAELD